MKGVREDAWQANSQNAVLSIRAPPFTKQALWEVPCSTTTAITRGRTENLHSTLACYVFLDK